ncbi:MAG: fumarate hydratase [Methanocellales archaeon]
MVSEDLIKSTVVKLLELGVIKLPEDVKRALKRAYEAEVEEVPKMQLKSILDNIELAEATNTPMCQDTGIPIFYINLPPGIGSIEKAIIDGVREATKTIPLRPNAVHPLTRKNPGDNVGEKLPYINYKLWDRNYLEITVLPKGAGSENWSSLGMLTPAQGIKGIKEFALNAVVKAGSNPCPPIIIGMGIGGSADIAMKLAKEALLRPIDVRHSDRQIAELEEELFNAINELGIGPMGLGGKTTLLGVNIEYAYCHTASHPVAINIQCWAARRASARIYPDGEVEYLTHKEGKHGAKTPA